MTVAGLAETCNCGCVSADYSDHGLQCPVYVTGKAARIARTEQMNDLRPDERATLEVRLNDLLRFLNTPGDWGYHTPMADLTLYLLRFRQKLQQSEK